MATKIDTVSARQKLKPRREQYWHRISKGCYVGVRKMTPGSAGSWWARYRDDNGVQEARSIGPLSEYPDHQRFDAAVKAAREWFEHLGIGGSVVEVTVAAACQDYVAKIKAENGDTPAHDLEKRFERWVYAKQIAHIELTKLTRDHVKAFRRQLVNAPVIVNKAGETRARAPDTINRDMTALRAALNNALADGKVITDFAWREGLKPIKNAGKRRTLYLDKDERRKLVGAASEDIALFLNGLACLPLRPGALAALKVADLDRRLGVLNVGKDKHGQNRGIKLPATVMPVLERAAKDKLPPAPLFSQADGKKWDKDAWKKPIKRAAAAAHLPNETSAYTLRHSAITDLIVHAGLDLLTVAQLSGTSVAMIEKHYGHLRQDVAALALAHLSL
jgi:integrase